MVRGSVSRHVPLLLVMFSVHPVMSNAPTMEEQELIRIARKHNHPGIREVVADVKHGWAIVEYFHKGVGLNKRVHNALSDCWQYGYARDDSSYSIKITEQDITHVFEQFVLEMVPHITYYEKQSALSNFKNDAYYFGRESQREFRPTIEKGQRLILKHLKGYIPQKMRQAIENGTDRVFRDGIRFLLYLVLRKHNNGFTQDDVRFINAKLDMFVQEMGHQYPYISQAQFESWICSLLHDLLFAECVVCMDHKADHFMGCCKTKSVCKRCAARVSSCPLCRAPKRK